MSAVQAKVKELALLADVSEAEVLEVLDTLAAAGLLGMDGITSVFALLKAGADEAYDADGGRAAAVLATACETQKSCPTRLLDGRNEIRCWSTAGHEGPCK